MSLSNPTNPPLVNENVATRVSTGVVFGVDENQTKVNQIHGINPAGSTGAGIPKTVSSLQASLANASVGATCTVSVRFQRDPSDNNFAGVKIYAKGYQGNNTPVQVGGGQDSPCTVILNNTGESVTLIVQSVGNGGVSPLASSPTYGIKLPKGTNGGVGTQTVTNLTTSQVPTAPTSVTLLVGAFALPWSNLTNPTFPIGADGSSVPVVAPMLLFAGCQILVTYVKGGVVFSTGQPITTDLQGDPNALGTGSSGGTFFPAHYVAGSTLKICGLVGAFTDNNGVIVGLFDLSGGSGQTFTVPAGATKVQFGINDVFYTDNSGPGYTITVQLQTSSGSGGTGGESAVEISAKGLGTNVFTGSNTSIAAWTQSVGVSTLQTTFNPFMGEYHIPQNACISINTGASPSLANCAIDFDFLWSTVGVFEFAFGCTVGGAGPVVQLDGRNGGGAWAGNANFTSWTNFAAGSTPFGINWNTGSEMWHHCTLVLNLAGTAYTLYIDGLEQIQNIPCTLQGTYIGINPVVSDVNIKSVRVTKI